MLRHPFPQPTLIPALTPSPPNPTDNIFQALLMACSSQQPKLIVAALQAMQKILSVTPVELRCLGRCLVAWRQLADLEDESVRLKVLQTLLLVISPANPGLLQEPLQQAVAVCLRLYAAPDPVIHNTAFAALQQLVSLLFDQVKLRLAGGPAGGPLPERLEDYGIEARNAYHLFADLCTVAGRAELPVVNPAGGTANQETLGGAPAEMGDASEKIVWLPFAGSIPAHTAVVGSCLGSGGGACVLRVLCVRVCVCAVSVVNVVYLDTRLLFGVVCVFGFEID